MAGEYEQWYDLDAKLQEEPRLIPSPELYDIDLMALYVAILNRMAQPLPDGSESPFSNQSPTTAHAILADNLAYFLYPLGHELNLFPDKLLIEWFRVLGAQLRPAQFPIIELTFTRHKSSIGVLAAEVPIGTEVRSRIDPSLIATTQKTLVIDGTNTTGTVPARLNRLGNMIDLKLGEFSVLPQSLNGIEAVTNNGTIVNPGMEAETLSTAVLRIREGIRTGSNGGTAQGRCVTESDYLYWAQVAGAQKVNVVRGLQWIEGGGQNPGFYPDLVTVSCYPETLVEVVQASLNPMAGGRCDVVPAHVIPINGTLVMRCAPDVDQLTARNLAAIAIRDLVNPPHGFWGDSRFDQTVATAVERMDRVYGVDAILKQAETDVPLADIPVYPWTLLEVQGSLEVVLG